MHAGEKCTRTRMVLCRCFDKRRHKNREENYGLGKLSMSVLEQKQVTETRVHLLFQSQAFIYILGEELISTDLKHGGWVDSEEWREGLTARAAWQPDGYHRDWDRKQELPHLLLFLLWLLFIPSVSPPSSTYVWEHRTQSTITARAEEEQSSEKLNNAR